MKRTAGPRTPWSLALLLIGGSLLGGLGLCESFVRIFIREPILPRFVTDAGYGVRENMPGIHTHHVSPGGFAVTVTTNRQGMRDASREYQEGKNDRVHRVALLGDSFVFGYGVEEDEVVSARLEELLNAAGTVQHEVLNFGVPGFGQTEELLLYRHKVRRFAPDAAVLFYFSNDLGNNVVSGLFTVDSTGCVVRADSAFLPGVAPRQRLYAFPPTRWLFEHSQLWNLLRNRLSLMVQQSLVRSRGMRSFNTQTETSVVLTRAVLKQFVAELQQDHVLPIVFVIPTREMETNFPLTKEEIAGWGARFVDGRDCLVPGDYFQRDTHWRPAGHEKAARELARVLRADPALDSARAPVNRP